MVTLFDRVVTASLTMNINKRIGTHYVSTMYNKNGINRGSIYVIRHGFADSLYISVRSNTIVLNIHETLDYNCMDIEYLRNFLKENPNG